MILNSRKNLSFAFLLLFAVLVSFGSVCAADINDAGNYTFGHLNKPTVPHHDVPVLIGNDSTAPNPVVNNGNPVLLTSGDDSASNDNNTNRTYSLGGLPLPDLHNGLLGDSPQGPNMPGPYMPPWWNIDNPASIFEKAMPALTNDGDLIAKALSDSHGVILDDNGDFSMSARYNTGTGYYWVVSSDSYGVDLISTNNVIDHPDACGSSATSYFKFHVTSDDYYVKLTLLSPTGEIVKEIDSNMINGL